MAFRFLAPVAVASAGVAFGLLLEEKLIGSKVRSAQKSGEGFGVLHGEPVRVLADDGVLLYT
ncbi:MAG: hypothetical protein HQ526_08560, partial [Actinobacteria bacterium]|nr:hypothetical protein [Actinomycetota bacterium]